MLRQQTDRQTGWNALATRMQLRICFDSYHCAHNSQKAVLFVKLNESSRTSHPQRRVKRGKAASGVFHHSQCRGKKTMDWMPSLKNNLTRTLHISPSVSVNETLRSGEATLKQ